MPWRETCPMDERMHFIVAHQRGELGMAELCRAFGISRKTGYKWLTRYAAGGPAALADQARAPHQHPQAIRPAVQAQVLGARQAHPTWGPRKLVAWLRGTQPALVLPAPSTVGDLLRRAGLVVPRRQRRHASPSPGPLAPGATPNAVWCADFKGQFRTGDGIWCYPLTLSDHASRYLLRCQALPQPGGARVWAIFEAAFREYGLPVAIRTDNGPPFAAVGLGGLTPLAVWWLKLGIGLERIAPGHPEQNGRHERLHRTLKAETAQPPAATLRAQQERFDRFRALYNDERPHEALGQQPPAAVYQPSARRYVPVVRDIAYPADSVVRRVRQNGEVRWRGQLVYVSMALVGEPVGLDAVDDGRWAVSFGPLRLGTLDERLGRIVRAQPALAHHRPPRYPTTSDPVPPMSSV